MVPKCCCTFKVLFPQHVRSPTWVIPVLILVAPPAGSLQAGVALHRQGVVGTLGTDYLTTPPAVMTAVELCWGGGGEVSRFAILSFNARTHTHTHMHMRTHTHAVSKFTDTTVTSLQCGAMPNMQRYGLTTSVQVVITAVKSKISNLHCDQLIAG